MQDSSKKSPWSVLTTLCTCITFKAWGGGGIYLFIYNNLLFIYLFIYFYYYYFYYYYYYLLGGGGGKHFPIMCALFFQGISQSRSIHDWQRPLAASGWAYHLRVFDGRGQLIVRVICTGVSSFKCPGKCAPGCDSPYL